MSALAHTAAGTGRRYHFPLVELSRLFFSNFPTRLRWLGTDSTFARNWMPLEGPSRMRLDYCASSNLACTDFLFPSID